MNLRVFAERDVKGLSAYYTPDGIANSLAEWAIRSDCRSVLEPSAGGGALVRAVLSRLRAIGGSAKIRVVACDVDASTAAKLKNDLGSCVQVELADFLALNPVDYVAFDAVIANPPFTRNHSIAAERRKFLREKFGVVGAAGLWVHFLLHAMSFLADGGRLASIVPASAAFTVYGKALLARLCKKFGSVKILQLTERPLWDGGADERGAVILAEDFNRGHCEQPSIGVWRPKSQEPKSSHIVASSVFDNVFESCRKISDVARLSIGAVTGRNHIFLMSEAERVTAKISVRDVCPVVSRAKHVRGVSITRSDLVSLAESGQSTWMLSPKVMSREVAKYLEKVSAADRESTAWFRKRDPWWKIDRGAACDAIFTYMNDYGYRIVLAGRGIYCTNTLHKVAFLDGSSALDRAAAVLTSLSVFGQLAAERLGRTYGGGVLKFELTDARNLPVLDAGQALDPTLLGRIDIALRSGSVDLAQELANAALLPHCYGKQWRVASAEMLAELTIRRHSRRHGIAVEVPR
ncbi:MAG: hypothetical protein JWM10_2823 [Myxococcaceae bacterium]|nr:hypothetical protein [Myxococcaceae bacterium]